MLAKKKWKNELKRLLLDLGFSQLTAAGLSKENRWKAVYPHLTPNETVDFILLAFSEFGTDTDVLLACR